MNALIRYVSVCAGIEAWTVASEGLGYQGVAYAEIDRFASAVLAHRFGSSLPGEPPSQGAPPNIGDFTRLIEDEALRASLGRVDLLVGGTPCQAFSFAGKRLSLADARGNLTLAFAVLMHELARSHELRNAVWENVPGVLSTPDNAFGCFLGALVGHDAPIAAPRGRKWPDAGMVVGPWARAAWRVLDAQYFGLAQRRERVLLVVDLGGGADPAAVLFEPQGLRGNSPPRREAGQGAASTLTASSGGCSGKDGIDGRLAYGGGNRSGAIDVAATLTARGHKCDFEVETFIADIAGTLPAGANSTGGERQPGMGTETAAAGYLIAHTLRGEGFDASEDGTGRGIPLVPIAFDTTQITSATNRCNPQPGDPCHPLAASAHAPAIAFDARQSDVLIYGDMTGPLDTDGHSTAIAFSCRDHGADAAAEVAPTLRAMGHGESHPNAGGQVAIAQGWAVRRLTPTEWARLQGFPDDHSRIAWRGKPAEQCPDGPQYKTYGNSMATKKMRWLARRLAELMPERAA